MADGYTEAGRILRMDADSSPFQEGESQILSKCDGCGALVTGPASQAKHDAFHAALADLFTRVS